MEAKASTTNKLILLYLISKLPGKTESELIETAINSCYLNYFDAKTTLSLIQEQGLIYIGQRKDDERRDPMGRISSRAYLSDEGMLVLNELSDQLALAVRHNIDELSAQKKDKFELADAHISHYFPDGSGQYDVECKLFNRSSEILYLKIKMPDEASAKTISRNWKKLATSKYLKILELLTKS